MENCHYDNNNYRIDTELETELNLSVRMEYPETRLQKVTTIVEEPDGSRHDGPQFKDPL